MSTANESEIKAPPSKPIGFQFDVKQWLGDQNVMKMSYAERGMHLHLMCIAWQESPPCTLPDDDGLLSRWLNIAEAAWKNVHKKTVMSAWKQLPDDQEGAGRWVLEGLQRSYLRQVQILASRQAAALARWQPKAEPTVEEDPKARIWRIGIELLTPELPDQKARPLIGKWIKQFGDQVVAEVLAKASIDPKIKQVADRYTYLTGMLSQHVRKDQQKQNGQRRGDLVL